jgi:hypothetical protein
MQSCAALVHPDYSFARGKRAGAGLAGDWIQFQSGSVLFAPASLSEQPAEMVWTATW